MAARDLGIFKVKVSSVEDKYCHFAVLIDLGSKTVKEIHVAAGTESEFRQRDLNEPFPAFMAWVQEVRYYYRVDPNLTQDLERMVKHTLKDQEFMSKLLDAFKKGSAGDLEYSMSTELVHILGDKNPRIEVALQKQSDAEQQTAAGPGEEAAPPGRSNFKTGSFLPLGFVMAPINGTYLPRVPLNTPIVVKFIKPGDPSSKTYLKNHKGPDEEHPERAHAILRETNSVPGTSQVQVIVELPGGHLGEIIEDSQDIKVKLAPSRPAKQKRKKGPVTEGYDMGPKKSFTPEFSLPFVIGAVVAVSLLLGVIVVLLGFL